MANENRWSLNRERTRVKRVSISGVIVGGFKVVFLEGTPDVAWIETEVNPTSSAAVKRETNLDRNRGGSAVICD